MLQVTSGSDYGLRGVIYLALRSPRGTMLISEIASAEEIPESYLAKIFQGLTRQGILRSTRGVGGGFSLARRPDRITLKDIVMACEGPILVARCLPDAEQCDKKDICGMCYVWEKLQDCIVSTLELTTIQDILNVIAERKAKQEVM